MRPRHINVVCVNEAAYQITGGAVFQQRTMMIVSSFLHVQGFENVLSQKRLVRFPRYLFYEVTQHNVAA